jgi:hypothetical protein
MALAHCILGKFLGVGCHFFPPPLDVPTFSARRLHVQQRERPPAAERGTLRGWEMFRQISPRIRRPRNLRDILHDANLIWSRNSRSLRGLQTHYHDHKTAFSVLVQANSILRSLVFFLEVQLILQPTSNFSTRTLSLRFYNPNPICIFFPSMCAAYPTHWNVFDSVSLIMFGSWHRS